MELIIPLFVFWKVRKNNYPLLVIEENRINTDNERFDSASLNKKFRGVAIDEWEKKKKALKVLLIWCAHTSFASLA